MTPNNKNNQQSNTNVNIGWRGPKGVHSFRCSDKLWKAFVRQIKAEGDSVCHVLEAILAGVLGLLKEDVYKRNTITIENLHVQRVVERVRRKGKVERHEFVPVRQVVSKGSYDACFGCGGSRLVSPHISIGGNRVYLCPACAKEWANKGKLVVMEGANF